jgi:hypothetical protein
VSLEEEILTRLLEDVPEAIGAIICDFEGEMVTSVLGAATIPHEAEVKALEHVPKQIPLDIPIGQFLMRLAGAEPCAVVRLLDEHGRRRGAGGFLSLHVCYETVEILVDPLPSDYYLVLVLKRPALASHARFHLKDASQLLSECVA